MSTNSRHNIASYADALWARHAIFLRRLRDEPKERLRRRLDITEGLWKEFVGLQTRLKQANTKQSEGILRVH